ncbi:MAG: KEOPS complex kinase/ATPase Bud32 [Candidatus Nanoarchaeia archaeon]
MQQLNYGAEGEIYKVDENWLLKKRNVQTYRHPQLDLQLRRKRVKREYKVLQFLLEKGVRVPSVQELNLDDTSFQIEFIKGECIVENMSLEILKQSIIEIANIHKQGVVHCDLTPLNIMKREESGEICVIDFGLSEFSINREERGVDLNVFFTFLQNDFPDLILHKDELLELYREEFNDDAIVDEILTRLEQIEKRGRNKNK